MRTVATLRSYARCCASVLMWLCAICCYRRLETVFALTAGQDKLINAFAVQVDGSGSVNASTSPDFTMIGHQDNVCALDVGPGESYVVSGSWDK